MTDTGLTLHLLGLSSAGVAANPVLLGAMFENFVAMELLKQIGWSRTRPQLYHFRDHQGTEVDLVLESRDGRMVGIEVKAGASVQDSAFAGLRSLAQAVGPRFVRGIVLYTGTETVTFGKNLLAVPLPAIWQ